MKRNWKKEKWKIFHGEFCGGPVFLALVIFVEFASLLSVSDSVRTLTNDASLVIYLFPQGGCWRHPIKSPAHVTPGHSTNETWWAWTSSQDVNKYTEHKIRGRTVKLQAVRQLWSGRGACRGWLLHSCSSCRKCVFIMLASATFTTGAESAW